MKDNHQPRSDSHSTGRKRARPAATSTSAPRAPSPRRKSPPPRPPRALRARKATPDDISPLDVEILLAESETGDAPDLADTRVVRRILRHHGVRPNKGFGQHLLVDHEALDAIVAAAEIGPADAVLEVGAGMGVLTSALAERAGRVVAVELERDILPVLRETTARFANVEIIARNLLTLRPAEVFGQQAYKLVANLPYYITAPTLRHFLESPSPPTCLVVMVQREVAERLVAGPGDLSLLGVSVQFYGQPRLVRAVPAASFYPPPKVDSAIVRIDVYPTPPLDGATRDRLFELAQAGFAERRKQIHNTLARHLMVPHDTIMDWLEHAGIDPKRRAETLSVDDWVRLTRQSQSSRPV